MEDRWQPPSGYSDVKIQQNSESALTGIRNELKQIIMNWHKEVKCNNGKMRP